jgi:hypothetical protein
MLKADELLDPTSYFNIARSDEPVFVLLARDVAAPAAIRAWVQERIRLGKNTTTDPQIVSALGDAARMESTQGRINYKPHGGGMAGHDEDDDGAPTPGGLVPRYKIGDRLTVGNPAMIMTVIVVSPNHGARGQHRYYGVADRRGEVGVYEEDVVSAEEIG